MATLTEEQFDTLVENYAQLIVDGMDIHSLEQFAYETIKEGCQSRSEYNLLDEIELVCDHETVTDLLDDCGVTPAQRHDLEYFDPAERRSDSYVTEKELDFFVA